ncbi:hypothetical protein ACWZEH_15810 [Streptomyces sp. QTS137]
MITQTRQIEQVTHRAPGAGPAGLVLALEVAAGLHPPVRRAPEATPATTRRRTADGPPTDADGRGRRTVRG